MIWQILVWFLAFIFFSGVGFAFERLLFLGLKNKERLRFGFFESIWLGVTAMLTVAHFISIFFPIDQFTFFTFVIISIFGWSLEFKLGNWKNRFNFIVSPKPVSIFFFIFFSLGFFLLIAYESRFPVTLSDTLIYHYNVVRWITDFPAIPGLIHIKNQLAYNNAFHMFASFFESSFLRDRSAHFAMGFLMVLVGTHWLSILLNPRENFRIKIFCLFGLIFISVISFGFDVNSLSADSSTGLIVLVMFGYSIMLGFEYTIMAILLGFIATTFKPIALPCLGFSGLLLLIEYFSASKDAEGRIKRFIIFRVGVICFLIFLGHTIRGAILSGRLFFPIGISYFNLHLPWSASDALTLKIYRCILAWPRDPSAMDLTKVLDSGLLAWYLPWLAKNFGNYLTHIVAMSIICVIVAIAIHFWKFLSRAITLRYFLALAVCTLSLLTWYFNTPDIRFGFFYPIILIALSSSLIFSVGPKYWKVAGVAIGIFAIVCMPNIFSAKNPFSFNANAASLTDFIEKDPPGPNVRFVKIDKQYVLPGIYSSLTNEPCGNSPVPCFYDAVNVNAPMREFGNIRKGFLQDPSEP